MHIKNNPPTQGGGTDKQKNPLKSAGYRGGDTGTPSHGAKHRLRGIPDKSPALRLALLLIVDPTPLAWLLRVLRPVSAEIKKPPCGGFLISGGDTGTRTLDPMIKSHLLYQLSYVPKTGPGKGERKVLFPRYGGNFDI